MVDLNWVCLVRPGGLRAHGREMKRFASVAVLVLLQATTLLAQRDWIRTGTGLGVERIRLAAVDFRATVPATTDLSNAFNQTLWNDLQSAGIFDMVSKSFYPLVQP